MLFEQYDPLKVEPEIINYLEQNKILSKLKDKNKQGKKFSFLQGPPYTSGKVHLGTAWNTSLKDLILRYKRSQGFNVWDRNGYDVHGLPTEHKVVEKYGLKFKEDIEKFGIGKFVSECKKFCLEMGDQMTKDFLRIGSTLDYSDSYMALKNDYIEGEWWLIKQAWDKKRLYLGEKAMTWCGSCATALAKHELEYKEIYDDSIYLKFKIEGTPNEYLLIWTTTPWTIPLNLAVVVHPEFDYVKCKVGQEYWIVAKELAKTVISKATKLPYEVVKTIKGKKLEGLEYIPAFLNAFPEISTAKKEQPLIFTVLLSSEYVHLEDGTGLVHFAPGCGESDYELCLEKGIKPFNVIDERGVYPKDHPLFGGLTAKKSDKNFIELMKDNGSLIAQERYKHSYAHCWRCRQAVVYRTTKQWFFKTEDLKEAMLKEDKKVTWVPPTNAFRAWTNNLRDNSITRQRYWGTAVPIWKCQNDECGEFDVIGSIKELQKKAGKVPEDLHRPWIDEAVWNCPKCKTIMRRIPDILDVWIDAGTCSWNCFYYPQKEEYMNQFFPPDLILEATEQVRLWFSMLSICSQLSMDKNSYKNVYMHGMLRGIDGEKMSKSLGNIISPDEMIAKHGADVLRYYMCQTNAGQDIKFSWDEAALKQRYLQILWNVHKLVINLAQESNLNPYTVKEKELLKLEKSTAWGLEEDYIISKLHSTIKKVTGLFDVYHLDETILPIEELYLELSRTYIQMIREKSSLGTHEEKEVCVYTIGTVLFECLKMFNIICPFMTEAIYLNLKEAFDLKEESICHYSWPKFDEKKIKQEVEQGMVIAQDIIASTLGAREKAQLGLRWPIKEVAIETNDPEVVKAVHDLQEIILKQTNSKALSVTKDVVGVKYDLQPNHGKIGPAYGELTPKIITALGKEKAQTMLQNFEKKGKHLLTIESGRTLEQGKTTELHRKDEGSKATKKEEKASQQTEKLKASKDMKKETKKGVEGRKEELNKEIQAKKEIEITKEMVKITRSPPDEHTLGEGKFAVVYVNTKRSVELDAEGYARELARHIQNLRKKAGLEKKDRVNLELQVSDTLKGMLKRFVPDISEKVGAESLEFKPNNGEEVKIKNEKVKVTFKRC